MSEAKRAMSPTSAAIPNASTQPIPRAVNSSGTVRAVGVGAREYLCCRDEIDG